MVLGAGAGTRAGARVRRRGPAPGPPAGQSARGDASFAAGDGPPQAPMLRRAARRAGRLPVPLRVPRLAARRLLPSQAGRGDRALPPFLSSSLLRSGARRAAGLQAPRPRGEQWARGEAVLGPRRRENCSGAQSAQPARLPGVRPAGSLAVSLSCRPGFVANHSRALLASPGQGRPARPGAPTATERSPAARPAYISGRLPQSALRQRSAPAPRNIHEAAAALGLP